MTEQLLCRASLTKIVLYFFDNRFLVLSEQKITSQSFH